MKHSSTPGVRHPTSCLWLLGLATSIAWSAACYPGEPTAATELDVVATTHDDSVDFSTIGTFVLPDSVVEIVPPESIGTTIPLNHAYDQLILDGVAAKLTALGYTRLTTFDAGNPPDVAVLVSAIASRNTDVYVTYPWYDYWGWYGWPPYGPGWGVGYPVVSDVVQYDVGTIVIDMWDIRRADPQAQRLPSIWTAALRGLLVDSPADAPARITQAIDRAFAQSPYLGTQ